MKDWLKKCFDKNELKKSKFVSWLTSKFPSNSDLWHFNRNSVSKAVAAGLLVAFIPIPIQIIFSVLVAILLRANLAVAASMTLLSNPFTFLPFTYLIYQVGDLITQNGNKKSLPTITKGEWRWENLSSLWHDFSQWFAVLGESYLVGLAIVSIGGAILGYCLVQIIWEIAIWYKAKHHK